MSMDTTFPENRLLWRAISNPYLHHVAYWVIIATEIVTAVLLWRGALFLVLSRNNATAFTRAKEIATAGYLLGLALWLGGFIVIGGEWFAMWQSSTWNGLESATRMVTILTLFLLLLHAPDEAKEWPHDHH